MAFAKAKTTPKAIGIVRVSQVRGREGDSFASPNEQRQRIEDECERRELRLLEVIDELDVSGGKPLHQRQGLKLAVEAVEAGEAQVLVAAYFDRLVRSLHVQDELVSRVEAAGGSVLAVDVGKVTNGSAAQWLSSTLLGGVAEYHRRVTAERVADAQARAIARGVAPWKNTTPGYTRNEDGVFCPNEKAPAVVKAFQMRAAGKSVRECREYLLRHGVKRTRAAVSRLFHDRAVLGELHFGELHNLEAHEPIVSPELFAAAGRASAPRGRKGKKSDLLLARLGVLRCASCNSRLVAGLANQGTTPLYRCKNDDCKRKVTISARVVEPMVIEHVKARIADVEGRATAEALAVNAIARRDTAQAKLDAAIRALAELGDEPAAIETLSKLRAARDVAREEVDQLGGETVVERVRGAADWDRLTRGERRDLIRLHAPLVTIRPGRGDRVAIEPLGE